MRHAISLDALRILDAIERKGSFGAAAEAMHRCHPPCRTP